MTERTERTGRPARSRGAGRTQKALNLVMRAVLSTPGLHRAVSDRILVLEVTGRKTGRRYRVPLGYAERGSRILVGSAGRWRRNLVADRPVRVVVARRVRSMLAEVITDEEQCADLYREILAHNPVHGRFVRIRTTPDGSPRRDDLRAALDRGVAVVRLRAASAET